MLSCNRLSREHLHMNCQTPKVYRMNPQSFFQAITLTISSLLLATLPAQAITVSGTFTDANAWQDALNDSNGQDFTLENRSLAGLDCSPYTNGPNYLTLSDFCNTGINSQLNVNNVLSDPEAALSETRSSAMLRSRP